MRLFGRIPRERVAGVVIDMQGESYLNGHDSGSVDKMVQSQISVLDYFASNNIPVVNFRNRFQLKDTGPVLPEILQFRPSSRIRHDPRRRPQRHFSC